MEKVKLNNGIEMPILGYGVYQVTPEECERCVSDAISVGYRSIDTAQAYHNEEGVGNAISKCGVPRGELFITTKVWISNAGYEKAKASIDESLRKLKSDYIDLLLIHQPFGDYYGTYRAMEEAYKAGKLRAIGVSNFYPDRFVDLAEFCEVTPAVNQVETHVFNQQIKLQEVMKEYGTKIMSWGPFADGRKRSLHRYAGSGKKYPSACYPFLLQCRHATAGHFGGKAELHGLLFSLLQFVYRLRSGNRERCVLYSEFQIDEPCMLPLHPLSLPQRILYRRESGGL